MFLRFVNRHIFTIFVIAAPFIWATYAAADRFFWCNGKYTILWADCEADVARQAGIYGPKDRRVEVRVQQNGQVLYRTPDMSFWPFYRQGESPQLIAVFFKLHFLSDKDISKLQSLHLLPVTPGPN
jgi:hypothetical protein